MNQKRILLSISILILVCGMFFPSVIVDSANKKSSTTYIAPIGAKVTLTSSYKKKLKKKAVWAVKTDGKTSKIKGSAKKGKKVTIGKKSSKVQATVKAYNKIAVSSKKERVVNVSIKVNGKKKAVKFNGKEVRRVRFFDPKNATVSRVRSYGKKDSTSAIYEWNVDESSILSSEVEWVAASNAEELVVWTHSGTRLYLTSLAGVHGKTSFTLYYMGVKMATVDVTVTPYGDGTNVIKDTQEVKDKDTSKLTEQTTTEQATTEQTTTEQATTEAPKAEYVEKYSYEVYPVHPDYTVYDQGEYYYFLKTDNPDGQTILMGKNNQYGRLSSGKMVADIGKGSNTVTGGYIFSIENPKADADGNYSFDIYEFDKDGLATAMKNTTNLMSSLDNSAIRAKVLTFSVKVESYTTAYNQLVSTIAAETEAGWEDWKAVLEESGVSEAYYTNDIFVKMSCAQNLARNKYGIGDHRVNNKSITGIGTSSTTETVSTMLNARGLSCAEGSSFLADIAHVLGYPDAGAGGSSANNSYGTHESLYIRDNGTVYEFPTSWNGASYSKEAIEAMQFNPASN